MLQTENDLLHGQTPLAEHTRGVAQHEAPHQAPHQVPVLGVLTVSLTGLGGSQVLQGAKHTRHPTAPSPPAEQLWGAPLRLQTQERDTVLTRYIDNDHGHLARGRTGGTPPDGTSPSRPPPSLSHHARLCGPLHPLPPNPPGAPDVWHTASSPTQVHCQRLWVPGLLSCPWRQTRSTTSSPKRRSRLSQERLGRAPRRRAGQCVSQPRTRQSAEGVRQPKSAGNITPTIVPRSWCGLRQRPAISTTRSAGRPRSSRA